MVRTALFLLLLNTSGCCGFGFKSCFMFYPGTGNMWCSNQNIANLTDVLSKIPDNTTKLNMSKNKINVIPPGSWSHLSGLKYLDMSQNKLAYLKGGAFRGLGVLKLLNLTRNNISHINSSSFDGLSMLQTLLLNRNKLGTISPVIFNSLPAIQHVDLSNNILQSLSCGDSSGSSTLQRLDLFSNSIRMINLSCFPALQHITLSFNPKLELQSDVFASNPGLKSLLCEGVKAEVLMGLSAETKRNLSWVSFSLSLEESPLTICGLLKGMEQLDRVEVDLKRSRLPETNSSLMDCDTPSMVVINNANLEHVTQLSLGRGNTSKLYLNNCGLMQISRTTFDGYPGLRTLQLNRNAPDIQRDTFLGLNHLTSLGVDSCRVRDVDPNWFVPLKKLTRLSLIKNDISWLRKNVFSKLIKLEELYLQFNMLKYINKPFSKLRRLIKLNLSSNIIIFIKSHTFEDLINLRSLSLNGNRIKMLSTDILSGLTNLRKMVLYNNRLRFKHNEAPFINLTSLEFLDMRYQGPARECIGVIGPNFFKGQSRLLAFKIGQSRMLEFHPDAFVPLINLQNLFIVGVAMKKTNLSAAFSPLKSLKQLTLRAALDVLPANLLPPDNSLEYIKVWSNHLHTVDKNMLDALPRLLVLDISDNPISCNCDNAWFKNWAIHNTQTRVSFLYDLRCDKERKSPFLWQFDEKACSFEYVSFTLFIACSVVDILFVCVCLAWHTQGPTVRYLLLVLRAKLRGRRSAKFQYDAFISYSSKDEGWVMKQLVPNLERPAAGAPPLRLCLHHRDFRPGAAVLENIEAAIYGSRHTICVVTRNFLQSEWCSVEFQLASLRLFYDGSDVLLLVFLEEIPERCLSPYTRLCKIVRKKTYLLWPEEPQEQDTFWVRLVDALKDKEEEEGEGGGEHDMARLIG
ncbi:toll-like receptor 13 [Pseudochaenichthys georgianus]|uniref:toll-like receptor 13 n=1 Tax=Pseudochaenichthys georgianus TaxID=52239 RepID=UPI00146DAC67|nr:toll-like receptor 13 [Pseudochaenichthys georgianus]